MKILYQQPHLVPPMKLTVYDDLPSTPGLRPPSVMSRVVSQGRTLASKASERTTSTLRKRPGRRRIGAPQPMTDTAENSFAYRPLELSIYLPSNRLSDLPEFDAASFLDDGTLKLPPKAILRTAKSEEALTSINRVPSTRRVASMCGDLHLGRIGHATKAASVISTSRPPSEYDALHSHPVSMISASGMSTQGFHQGPNAVTILSPIKDEFTPPPTGMIESMVDDFPQIENNTYRPRPPSENLPVSPPPPAVVPPAVTSLPPVRLNFKPSRVNSASFQPSKRPSTKASQSQYRVAQWVHRGHSSSVSSNSTISTFASCSTSFSEHRRKRSQFYQCQPWNSSPEQTVVEPLPRSQPEPTPAGARNTSPTQPFTPPKPLPLSTRATPQHSRSRTMSSSTVASTTDTVDTNILSLDDDDKNSDTTTSSVPVVQDVRINMRTSRQQHQRETVRSFSKPLAVITTKEFQSKPDLARTNHSTQTSQTSATEEEGLTLPIQVPPPSPPPYQKEENVVYIKEIGGPLRSPGVGVAF